MEFNGFAGADFDFFRRKDKITKDEYEKLRNEVKLHFRGLLYSLQKKYHQKTNGVLELQKDFQNFNKRSINIESSYKNEGGKSEIGIILNSDHLKIDLNTKAESGEEIKKIMTILKDKKNLIWEQLSGNKFMIVYYEPLMKNKKENIVKLTSHDISNKNYEAFIKGLEKYLDEERCQIKFGIGAVYHKNESVKQGKNLENIVFDTFMKFLDLKEKLVG